MSNFARWKRGNYDEPIRKLSLIHIDVYKRQRVRELGMDSIAITDHGVMYGVIDFYRACRTAGVHPVIGCEVYVAPRSLTDKVHGLDSDPYHLVLLCENMTGYKNLCFLVSRAFVDGFYNKPRVDLELLAEHSEGLIALSACLAGAIPQMCIRDSRQLMLWQDSVWYFRIR